MESKRRRKHLRVIALALLFVFTGIAVAGGLAGANPGTPPVHFPLIFVQYPSPTPSPIPARVLISEVLFDPAGAEEGEWIELYNPGDFPYDLSKVKLGDEESPGGMEGMYVFPNGTQLAARQTIVIASHASIFIQNYSKPPDFELNETDPAVPNLAKDLRWANGSLELVNTGDEVLVYDPAGNTLLDAVSWGSSVYAFSPAVKKALEGHSIERRPAYRDTDSAADWADQPSPQPWERDLSTPTPTPVRTATRTPLPKPSSTPTPFPAGSVLISEVLYHSGQDPQGEWIEIYNLGSIAVPLPSLKIGDAQERGVAEGMRVFPPEEGLLAPGAAIVVANRADAFLSAYGFEPDFELEPSLASVPDMAPYNSWSSGPFSLNNAGDEVLLLGPGDRLEDSVSWGVSTWAFDPPVTAVAQGHSIERRPAYLDSDRAIDWKEQSMPDPGRVSLTPPTATPIPTFTPTPIVPAGSLLISEVMVNPAAGIPGEWVEVFNPTGAALPLDQVKLGDEETQYGGEAMLRFPDGALIPAGGALVVAGDGLAFYTTYGFWPDYEITSSATEVPDMITYPEWAAGLFNLQNADDQVLLLNGEDSLIDALSWGSSTWAFDPAVPAPAVDHSLERYPPNADSDSAADWREQASPSPGTVPPVP